MVMITPSQMRMMHVLARERGIDDDTLHAHIFGLFGKESKTELSVMEAAKVIDSLKGDDDTVRGMMTAKQRKYIEGLALEAGLTDDDGGLDQRKFRKFIRNKFGVDSPKWIDCRTAGKIIEGLKVMARRRG
jgi:hypothetical protein